MVQFVRRTISYVVIAIFLTVLIFDYCKYNERMLVVESLISNTNDIAISNVSQNNYIEDKVATNSEVFIATPPVVEQSNKVKKDASANKKVKKKPVWFRTIEPPLPADNNANYDVVDYIDESGNSIDIFNLRNIDENYIANAASIRDICNNYTYCLNNNLSEWFYVENYQLIKKLSEHMTFIGDSNVTHIRSRLVPCPIKYVYDMPGKNLYQQEKLLNDYDYSNIDTVILWNSFNIKVFHDGNEYINQYKSLIENIYREKSDVDVRILSFLPASVKKLKEDILQGSPHNIHLSAEYDGLLKERLSKYYIDIKFLFSTQYYSDDGYHFNKDFYVKVIPYVVLYLNVNKYINVTEKEADLYENMRRIQEYNKFQKALTEGATEQH